MLNICINKMTTQSKGLQARVTQVPAFIAAPSRYTHNLRRHTAKGLLRTLGSRTFPATSDSGIGSAMLELAILKADQHFSAPSR